jgi:adenylylsulfate kinase-like enzyme
MHAYFSKDLGKRHVFVLYGLGGAGKSQIALKFIEECQFDGRTQQ